MENFDLRSLQLVELDILKYVADICDKHQIPYYLMDGTLLGAVRHKGFIPWDDDVDIAVPRPYFDKLIDILAAECQGSYSVRNYKISAGYEKLVTRVVNEQVKLFHDSYAGGEQAQPAWIDVFPLDGMPNSRIGFQLHKYHFLWTRLLYHYSCFDTGVNLSRTDRSTVQKLLIWVGKTFRIGRKLNTRKLLDKMEEELTKYRFDKSKYVVNAYSSYMFKETYKREWFNDTVHQIFEDGELSIPTEYDAILTHLYGDYMVPPANPEVKHSITKIDFGEWKWKKN